MENNLTPKQALEELRKECNAQYFDENGKQWWTTDKKADYRCNIIEQALTELETIKKEHAIKMCMTGGVHYDKNNLTPNQALNCLLATLKDVRRNPLAFLIEETNTNKYAKVIEQALTDYEKQKQILDVLKNKIINTADLADFDTYEDYLVMVDYIKEDWEDYETLYALTETEFNLIKEWLK